MSPFTKIPQQNLYPSGPIGNRRITMRRVSIDTRSHRIVIVLSFLVVVSAFPFAAQVVKAPPGQWSDIFVDQSKIFTKVNTDVMGGNVQIVQLATDYSWQKKGVVLDLGGPGDPDEVYAYYPWVLRGTDGVYRMWYSAVSGSGTFRIAHATSHDGYNWTKLGSVISPGFSGTVADEYRVFACAVIYDQGLYKMWYTGQTISTDFRRILYATSPDGLTWTPFGISLPLGGAGESKVVGYPSVMKDGSTYKMWYSGFQVGGSYRIYYATSLDGQTWSRQGLVVPLGPPGQPDDDEILKNVVTKNSTGDYRMWYGGAGSVYRVLYAESPDGLDWSDRHGIVISEGPPGSFDEAQIHPGGVRLPVNNAGYMWYGGMDTTPTARIFTATMGSLGNVTSVEITKSPGYDWETLFLNKTVIPDETEVLVSVLDSAALKPYPGYSELSGTVIDLSSLPSGDDTIRLQANLYGTISASPLLHDWTVTWNDVNPPSFGGITSAVDDGTDGDVTLDWNPASDFSTPITYNVYMSLTSMGQNFASPNYTTQAIGLQIPGLTNGITHYFIVRAEDSLGNEETNTVEMGVIPTTPVDSTEPSFAGLQSALDVGTGGNVSLSWNAATDPDTPESNSDPSLPITYNIYYSTTSGGQDFLTPDATTTGLNQQISGLADGTVYYFVVRAEDSAGNEESNVVELSAMPTTPIDSTPPSFTGLGSVTDLGTGGTLQLAWTAATDPDTIECNSDPSLPIAYNVYYSKVPGGQDFMNPNASTTNTQIDISGLDNGVFYYFVVRGRDSAGNEETNVIEKSAMPTTPVDSTPPNFGGIQFAVDAGTGGTVSLNWLAAIDPDTIESNSDPSLPINYDIFYSTTSGGQNFLSPNATTPNLMIDISGLTDGVAYYFVVRARDAVGNQETNTVERTALPTTPTDDTPPTFAGIQTAADTLMGGNVSLTWSPATDPDTIECNSDPSVPITYSVYASTLPGNQNFLLPNATTQNTQIYITGLKDGVTYYFVVRARDSVGNQESNVVELSAMPTTPVDLEPPVFSGLVLASDAGTGGSVDLVWAAATDPDLIECNSDPSLPITYNIYYSTTSGGQNLLVPDATTPDTSIRITGLQDGADYYFIVRAEDSAGNEETNTVEDSAMPTTPIDTTPPQFTGLLSATDLGTHGNVSLTWSAATDPDTIECNSDPSTPIQFNIYYSTASGAQDFQTPSQTTTGTQAIVTGLQNGVTYFFVVRAEDAAGNEENNVIEHTVMPTTPVDSTPPTFGGVTNVIADDDTGDITLVWNVAVDPDEPECNSDPSTPIIYNIYVSEVPGSFDFAQPTATTSQQQYPFLDLERGVTYYFTVRAEDGAGNEETNTISLSGELAVEDVFDLLDYWWLLLLIIIIIVALIAAVLAKRRKKEEEPTVEEEPESETPVEEEPEEASPDEEE